MDDPTNDGYSIDNYRNYASSDQEVHRTSGIANNAFLLMVQGGKNRTSGLGVDPSKSMGMARALQILYRAQTVYFTPDTTFRQAGQLRVKAAEDLYGKGSQEAETTRTAWKPSERCRTRAPRGRRSISKSRVISGSRCPIRQCQCRRHAGSVRQVGEDRASGFTEARENPLADFSPRFFRTRRASPGSVSGVIGILELDPVAACAQYG